MANTNKRGLELSFKRHGKGSSKGRWYSTIGGKIQYFGWSNGITDREGYQTALNAFRIWQGKQTSIKINEARGPVPASLAGMTWTDL